MVGCDHDCIVIRLNYVTYQNGHYVIGFGSVYGVDILVSDHGKDVVSKHCDFLLDDLAIIVYLSCSLISRVDRLS